MLFSSASSHVGSSFFGSWERVWVEQVRNRDEDEDEDGEG